MLEPPSSRQRMRELLVGRDVLRLVARSPRLRSLPPGADGPVVLVPGFGAGDSSLAPLRGMLRHLGHDARPAGLGVVTDDVLALSGRIGDVVRSTADETGRAVALVGWSIGGVLCREVTRDDPEPVRRVITFGTPVVGGPSYTALAGRYGEQRLAAIRAEIERRSETPIRRPITAIWSANDGIVTPAACIDQRSPHVEHVEVSSTHLGMGLDPDVWTVVADRLAVTSEAGNGA